MNGPEIKKWAVQKMRILDDPQRRYKTDKLGCVVRMVVDSMKVDGRLGHNMDSSMLTELGDLFGTFVPSIFTNVTGHFQSNYRSLR